MASILMSGTFWGCKNGYRDWKDFASCETMRLANGDPKIKMFNFCHL